MRAGARAAASDCPAGPCDALLRRGRDDRGISRLVRGRCGAIIATRHEITKAAMNDLSDLSGAGPAASAAGSDAAAEAQAEKQAELRRAALEYHEFPTPGKISIAPTKNAHEPARPRARVLARRRGGVRGDRRRTRATAFRYTARGNLVGVITNGTAVLGLGAIGPLAAKPVMEGKAVLFKKFAGIDVFDIEVDERDPHEADRGDRGARADVRRHQPRGHQGARVLRDRARAAQAHEDPGLPRRPARHGDHRRRGDDERADRRRQEDRGRQARRVGRGRGGARVPRPARRPRPADRRTSG